MYIYIHIYVYKYYIGIYKVPGLSSEASSAIIAQLMSKSL